jgi:uncharacterized Zn finger protein (UPF0148 family)
MFRQQNGLNAPKKLTCKECESTLFRIQGSKITCTNCGWTEKGVGRSKYGAKRTEFNGKKYDSKFEAGVAEELELRKRASDIKDYDTQFRIDAWAYRADGTKAFCVKHKVDFRVHHNDGSYELLEAKGVETADYRMRRRFLEELWLPEHKDHIYTVVRQGRR